MVEDFTQVSDARWGQTLCSSHCTLRCQVSQKSFQRSRNGNYRRTTILLPRLPCEALYIYIVYTCYLSIILHHTVWARLVAGDIKGVNDPHVQHSTCRIYCEDWIFGVRISRTDFEFVFSWHGQMRYYRPSLVNLSVNCWFICSPESVDTLEVYITVSRVTDTGLTFTDTYLMFASCLFSQQKEGESK